MAILILGSMLAGCQPPAAPPAGGGAAAADPHDHPAHGPHGGDLIELGDEQYHAELLVDETTHDITLYVLDGSAKTAVPIAAAEVTINVKLPAGPVQHKLPAAPQAGDAAGQSSRFALPAAQELHEQLESEEATARLQLTIAGESFSGAIEHSHDHDHADHGEHANHGDHGDEEHDEDHPQEDAP